MNIVLILLLSSICAGAQTLTTNFVTAAPSFREVRGQLYNTQKSVLWKSFTPTVTRVNAGSIEVNWTETRGVYERHSYGGTASGNMMSGGASSTRVGEQTIFDKQILIVNYPTNNVADGQKLNVWAMQTGTTNFDGRTLELWDCGTPHVVLVVTTNRLASATNKVSR